MGELFLPLEGLIDVEAERARVTKEIAKVEAELAKVRAKLADENFTAKVPQKVLDDHRQREADWAAQQGKLSRACSMLWDEILNHKRITEDFVSSSVVEMSLNEAIANTRAHLLSLRNAAGHWEGELVQQRAVHGDGDRGAVAGGCDGHARASRAGAQWLVANQNADGGWGDTTISKSNLSTTLLCWSALSRRGQASA